MFNPITIPFGAVMLHNVVKLEPGVSSDDHIAIITCWQSFEQHEKSHADSAFKEKFDGLAEYCSETWELGYNMLWQGTAE